MSAAQDRAEAYIRARFDVLLAFGIATDWPAWARRIVEILEAHEGPVGWGRLREAFGDAWEAERGVHDLLRVIEPEIVQRVFWRDDGEPVPDDEVKERLRAGLTDEGRAAWEAWSAEVNVGWRLAPPRPAPGPATRGAPR